MQNAVRDDLNHMHAALALARRGLGTTWPNPSVGCVLVNEGRVVGKTLYLAQTMFSIRSYPGGDGRVRVELVPEIEHGQPRTRYVGQPNDGSLRLDTGRERAIFNELRFEPQLAPGDALLLTCTDAWKGLGRQFFAESSGDVRMQRVIVIRLAQTQLDDLFSGEVTENELE